MSQWANEHPEQMAEIARLPLREQNAALRGAMFHLIPDEDEGYYFPDHPEPEPVDWRGNVLKVGDRVRLDVRPECIAEPVRYNGTVTSFDWDEDGLYMSLVYEDGDKETVRGFGGGVGAVEFGDYLKVEAA